MSERKKCKYCQSEIEKKARICPNCRKKQGGKGKFIVIGVIVLIVLIGALGNNKDTTQTSNNNGTNTQQNADSSADSENKAIALGSEGKSDDLILKVNVVGEKKEITEGDFISYKPDSGKFAIINITIKNAGKEADSLTNGYFKLVTAGGVEYSPSMLIGLSNKYISFESINPGLETTGNLVFEVPNDLVVADAMLRFSGTGLFTAPSNFSLK